MNADLFIDNLKYTSSPAGYPAECKTRVLQHGTGAEVLTQPHREQLPLPRMRRGFQEYALRTGRGWAHHIPQGEAPLSYISLRSSLVQCQLTCPVPSLKCVNLDSVSRLPRAAALLLRPMGVLRDPRHLCRRFPRQPTM
jgi:hypothetical protein